MSKGQEKILALLLCRLQLVEHLVRPALTLTVDVGGGLAIFDELNQLAEEEGYELKAPAA